jgi:hypothetical protein
MPTRTENGIKRKRTAYLGAVAKAKAGNGPMPSWRDYLVVPIAEAIQAQLGKPYTVDVGPQMGLRARVSVTIFEKDGPKDAHGDPPGAWLSFEPGDLANGEVRLTDYSRIVRQYPPNSIGDINGLQYGWEPRPDLLELMSRVHAQLREARAKAGGA